MNNFLVRTLSSIVFLVVMVAGMLFHPAAFGVLFLVVLYMAMKEFLHITMGHRRLLQQRLAMLAGAVAYIISVGVCFYGLGIKWLFVALPLVLLIPVSELFASSHEGVEDLSYAILSIVYIAFPLCLTPFIVSAGGDFRGYVLLNFFIIIWCADVGSYSIGTLFGQKPTSRKLAPSISPKKSWWGFWGGIVLGVAGAWVLHLVGWLEYPLVHCLVLGVIIPVAGVCGDLFESLWKRRYGFKDSGNCIPGHGGMLDRFDSSLFAIPVAFAYLTLSGLL
ncbi:MAG: phosphatidate cytidylyltransferase [Bacteroidales bacterium]|nr:phosphatidate cytidylyltransferase [Bacteroidales bacterium]